MAAAESSDHDYPVALLAEGVDRNIIQMGIDILYLRSPYSRRAWI